MTINGYLGLIQCDRGDIGLGTLGGFDLSIGIGYKLSLGVGLDRAWFDSAPINSIPFSIRSHFSPGKRLNMQVVGGIGPAFSDLPQWQESNVALSAYLGLTTIIFTQNNYQAGIESTFRAVSTSTDNLYFFTLVVRISFKL